MRTYVAKPAEALLARKWWVLDAKGQPLGRLATKIAMVLRGKHKPTFTPHVDTGDYVIVVNAAQTKMTGNKAAQKIYYRHSGYPGGITGKTYEELMALHPSAPIELAVRGMLPKSKLGRAQLHKLKVYQTAAHPHAAQQPQPLSL